MVAHFYCELTKMIETIFLGAIGSIVAALGFIAVQFWKSNAGFRLRSVMNATAEFSAMKTVNGSMSGLRNKFRYSLGVFLDELFKTFPANSPFPENGPWPMVIDFDETNPNNFGQRDSKGMSIDRWSRYDRFIRPIIDDLNSYAFLGWISPFHFRLRILVRLCNCFEAVVAEIDSAIERGSVRQTSSNEIEPCDLNSQDIDALRSRFRNLHHQWSKWVKSTAR